MSRRKNKKNAHRSDYSTNRFPDVQFVNKPTLFDPVPTQKRTKKPKNVWFSIKNAFHFLLKNIVLILFLLLGTGVFIFLKTSNNLAWFKINNVLIINDKDISEEQKQIVISYIEKQFSDKTIFSISTKAISQSILKNVTSVDKIYVRKIMPDTLEVEIYFKTPQYVLSNLKGYVVVDSSNQIIFKNYDKSLNLSEFELRTLNGLADPNSAYVKDQYLLSLETDEARKQVDWEKVPLEEKQNIADQIMTKTQTLLSSYQEILYNNIKLIYPDLPIYFFYNSEDLVAFEENSIYKDSINFSNKLSDDLAGLELEARNIEWVSDFTCKVTLKNESVLLFLIQRSYEDQINDLRTVLWNNKMEANRTFDFRTSNFTIY